MSRPHFTIRPERPSDLDAVDGGVADATANTPDGAASAVGSATGRPRPLSSDTARVGRMRTPTRGLTDRGTASAWIRTSDAPSAPEPAPGTPDQWARRRWESNPSGT